VSLPTTLFVTIIDGSVFLSNILFTKRSNRM